jgi:hypothetical protein
MPSVMRFNISLDRSMRTIAIAICIIASLFSRASYAANTWDSQALTGNNNPAGDNTQWWFDPYNWSGATPGDAVAHFLPPSLDAAGSASTDTQINVGTTTLPGGQGVVYDPSSNDPNFATAGSYNYPTGGFGPQVIGALYIARNTTATNVLTIKGDLQVGLGANTSAFQVGRSGSSTGSQNLGEIIQTAGTVTAPTSNLDIGQWEASGWGNGTYDYRGGTLDVYNNLTNHGIRISHGSAGNGTGGVGRFIMHNPASGGYVRTYTLSVASDRTNGDGITRGVGILEFDYENGNTRPIQVLSNLSINNGLDNTPQGAFPASTRSSRLDLVLHSAPTLTAGVPQNLGLIDVNFRNLVGGVINGTGDLDGDTVFNDDRVFSNANAPNPLAVSAAYYQDSIVSAVFGSTKYNWKISYTGNISWTDDNNSVVGSVTGTGGTDVVLIGLNTESVGLPGDFNNDGKVDAGDYATWRKNAVANATLPNDNGVGNQASRFSLWRANFGNPPGAGSSLSSAAVPEPHSILLTLCGLIGVTLARRQL